MKVYVFENGLKNSFGHHLNNTVGLKGAFLCQGYTVDVLVNNKADQASLSAVGGRLAFTFSPYDRFSADSLCGELESFLLQSRVLGAEMSKAVGSVVGAEDLVVVTTATHIELLAMSFFIASVPENKRPKVALNFIKENFIDAATGELSELATYYRFAAKSLFKNISRNRMVLSSNSSEMARLLSEVMDIKIQIFPIPKTYPDALTVALDIDMQRTQVVVGVFGDMNPYKGFQILPALVKANPSVSWLIQNAKNGSESFWGGDNEWMNEHPGVQMVSSGLSPDEYYELYSRVDIVLMPYNPAERRLQTSGVFAEAVAAGRVIVCPATAWVSEKRAEQKWSGETFNDQDAAAISAALRLVLSDLDCYKSSAKMHAIDWAKTECVNAFAGRVVASLCI